MKKNYVQTEELAKLILEKSEEFSRIKHIYCQCLIENGKFNELYDFIKNKISELEKKVKQTTLHIILHLDYIMMENMRNQEQ